LKNTIIATLLSLFIIGGSYADTTKPVYHFDFSDSDGKTVLNKADNKTVNTINFGELHKLNQTQALCFDGYITHMELKNTRKLNLSKGVTIAAWLAPDQMKRNTIVIGRANPNRSWSTPTVGLYFPQHNKLGMGLWTPKKCRLEANAEINPGEWIFAVCTWDHKTAKIYINGELKGEEPCIGKLPAFEGPFYAGSGNAANHFYKGKLGETRIYERAVSIDEIKALYSSTSSLYPKADKTALPSNALIVRSKRQSEKQWKEYETRTLENMGDFKPGRTKVELNQYGGWTAKKSKATGFFRTEKIDGRWWLIDPEGCYFIHIGMACVRVGNSLKSIESFKKLYERRSNWADETLKMLRAYDFNGIGNWSDYGDLRASSKPMPYTIRGGFMSSFAKSQGLWERAVGHSGYTGDSPPVFSPEFPEFCRKQAKSYAKHKDDPWLVGVFSDNEIIRPDLNRFLNLDPTDPKQKPNYDAAVEWLKQRQGTEKINIKAITLMDQLEFAALVFEHYYRIVSKAIKHELPNHMYLGSRLHSPCYKNPFIVERCGKYSDVISINYYGSWNPDSIEYWEKIAKSPIMITEFYTKGADSGLPNTTGAGWVVPTQKERGYFYQNFILGLLESSGCVGWHWFKYMDNDPDNKRADPSNIDSNKGILKINFEPYPPLLKLMKEINHEVYPLTEYYDD
jgi:hypothetical protein